MTTDYAEGSVYLTLAQHPRWWRTLRPVKATAKKPTSVPTGAVVVKLMVRLPMAAFKPLEPEAVLVVPEELVQRPVYVEAVASDD